MTERLNSLRGQQEFEADKARMLAAHEHLQACTGSVTPASENRRREIEHMATKYDLENKELAELLSLTPGAVYKARNPSSKTTKYNRKPIN